MTQQDPLTVFTGLGVAGVVAVVLYMWQRETAKQRDRAMNIIEDLADQIGGVKTAIEMSTKVHTDSASASQHASTALSEALQRIPTADDLIRMRVALEQAESSRHSNRSYASHEKREE